MYVYDSKARKAADERQEMKSIYTYQGIGYSSSRRDYLMDGWSRRFLRTGFEHSTGVLSSAAAFVVRHRCAPCFIIILAV